MTTSRLRPVVKEKEKTRRARVKAKAKRKAAKAAVPDRRLPP